MFIPVSYLLLLLINVEFVLSACTTTTVKQDLILMIDYSDSICPEVTCCENGRTYYYSWNYGYCNHQAYARCCQDEWPLMLDFAKDIVADELPGDSEILVMGFGEPSGYVWQGWYADEIGNRNTVWKTKQEVQNDLSDITKVGGSTYLGAGIDYLLDESGISWETERLDRKRLMVVFTDGQASDEDSLCNRAPRLRALGIQTIIVGITNDFDADSMKCIVENEDTDIIHVDSWNGLDEKVSVVGELTCESNQQWTLTEIKAGGTDKFIEFTNIGNDYVAGSDSDNVIRIESNIFNFAGGNGRRMLLNNYLELTESAPQWSRIVIGSAVDAPAGCQTVQGAVNDCFYYGGQTISPSFSGPDGWTANIYDYFDATTQNKVVMEVSWNSDFPSVSDTFSLELTSINLDATVGSNWRVSCAEGGSFGDENSARCGACSSNAQCEGDENETANFCCFASDTSCAPDGCHCTENGYYDGASTRNYCNAIPPPVSCTFFTNSDSDKTDQYIEWEASPGNLIFGYTISAQGAGEKSVYSSRLRTSFTDQIANNARVTVKAIGQATTGSNPTAQRWSKEIVCDTQFFTDGPSVAPSGYPSPVPTEFVPLVFFSGFTLTNDEINDLVFFDNDETIDIDIRIYLSPPEDAVIVYWVTYDDAGVEVERGEVEFPEDALGKLQDTKQAELTRNKYGLGDYTIELLDTNATMSNDKPGFPARPAYKRFNPDTLGFKVKEFIRAPTPAPTDYQPYALLSGYTMNNETDPPIPNPMRYQSNEDFLISIRILPSVPFEVEVSYQVTDPSTNAVVDSGTVTFPANALDSQEDTKSVRLRNISLVDEEMERTWNFEILPTTARIPSDGQGSTRKLYELFNPYMIDVEVERFVESAVTLTETKTEETLDWWLILIICLIALGLLALVGFIGYRYYIKYKLKKQEAQDLGEELAFEEDGIDGFYDRAGVEHRQENPLHAKREAASVNHDMGAAEMIAVDDNAFVMNNDRVIFEQRTIGKRESELDNFNMHNVGSGEAIGEGPISSGEKSPSTYQVQEGTFPDSFNKERSGSLNYHL